jgi:hypothetical protein
MMPGQARFHRKIDLLIILWWLARQNFLLVKPGQFLMYPVMIKPFPENPWLVNKKPALTMPGCIPQSTS